MSGVQELPAVISPVGVISAKLTTTTDRPRYPGPYDVTPAADAQELATKGLVMDSDVTVGGMGEAIEKAEKDAIRTVVDGSYTGEYRDEEVVTVNQSALAYVTGLTSVDLPAATSVGSNAFQGCTGLTSVDLPAATSVGTNAFQGCTSLPELTLPAARTCDTSSIRGCTSLVRLILPLLSYVGWTMACDCTSLGVFDTGTPATANPITLGSNGFQRCSSLVAVVLRRESGVVSMGALSTFNDTPIANGTGYIYVPRALVDKYKVATNWSVYADQIRAIEDYPEICDPE